MLKNGVDPKWLVLLGLVINLEKGIGQGAVSLTNMIPNDWIPHVLAWCNGLAWAGVALMTALAALSSNAPGPLVNLPSIPSVAIDTTKTVVKILLVAFAASFLLAGHSVQAAEKFRPLAVTGNIPKDIRTDLGISDNAGIKKNADGSIECDFNIFLMLNPKNLEQVVKACVTDADSKLIQDVQSALTSAQGFTQTDGGAQGDTPAVQCLKPGLAILQAALPRPAVAAVEAQPATATTPAVAAVAAQAAYNPGLVTLFQKFREFELVGGPAACQNWVNGTVSGAIAPAAGAVGAVAGAALLAPK